MKDIANIILNARKTKGWSRQTLAEKMGTSPQQIEKLEKGFRQITIPWIGRLAKALDKHPSELLPLEWQAPQKINIKLLAWATNTILNLLEKEDNIPNEKISLMISVIYNKYVGLPEANLDELKKIGEILIEMEKNNASKLK